MRTLAFCGFALFGLLACSSSSDETAAAALNGVPTANVGGSAGGSAGGTFTVIPGGGSAGAMNGAAGTAGYGYAVGAGGSMYGTGGTTGTTGGATGAGSPYPIIAADAGTAIGTVEAGAVPPPPGPDGGEPTPSDAAADVVPATDVLADGQNACTWLDREKPVILYQSSDDSNSMASPAIARRLIKTGQAVPAGILRTYEFLNYYKIAYQPAPATRVRVVPELRPGTAAGEYALQIGIQSEPAMRRPMNVTFVLDSSGSMSGSPIEIEKAAVKAMAGVMQAGDRVSLLTWNTAQNVILDGYLVTGANDPRVVAAADSLIADGSTDLSGGLNRGYALAQKYYAKEVLNRVVLISDGQANVGVTDEQLIGNASHSQDDEGIYLVGVSVGDGINDTLMNVVTDKGRGAYVYLDSTDEAVKMLNRRFEETMEVAARGVRLELTLPWYFAMKTFSGEQSSTVAAEVDPQHLAPDDAMVFNETFVACDPDMVKTTDLITARATYQTPITHELRDDSATMSIGDLLAASDVELKKGSAIVAYAEALKFAASWQQPGAARQKLADALSIANAANPNGTDPELVEIAALITQYMSRF